MLLRVMEALNAVPCDLRILACPEDCEIPFKAPARRGGFELFAGDKEDVLARFCAALDRFFPSGEIPGLRLIRATGDNPFVFADAASAIHEEALALGADYAGFSGLPTGAGVEALSASALLAAEKEARGDEREHVCPFLYKHPERFYLHRPLAPPEWRGGIPPLSLTVDTREDYDRALVLYDALERADGGGYSGRYSGGEIIAVCKSCFGVPR
jgi:spore coat polysaccharide biosynthesis protein SpsF